MSTIQDHIQSLISENPPLSLEQLLFDATGGGELGDHMPWLTDYQVKIILNLLTDEQLKELKIEIYHKLGLESPITSGPQVITSLTAGDGFYCDKCHNVHF